MSDIHMGELLERAIRKKGVNITELARALNITRRTMYNLFKREVIDKGTMERISSVINYDEGSKDTKPQIIKVQPAESLITKDEAYWQDKYIDLLERYSKLLSTLDT
jgi:transcriptional regulator with XRE-family HTH domain